MYSKVDQKYKGNVGIFLVAAKLSAMNMIALTTSRNTKGYDIIVLNPETNQGKGIQIKCTDKKDFPVTNSFLKTIEEELQKKLMADFVFVDISGEPRFFILSKDEVKGIILKRTEEWLSKSKHRKSIEEMKQTGKRILHTVSLSDIEKYENNWKQILQDLQ